MTSTPGLRPITEADVPAVLALNHRFVDLLSPLDAERLLWLVGLADQVGDEDRPHERGSNGGHAHARHPKR